MQMAAHIMSIIMVVLRNGNDHQSMYYQPNASSHSVLNYVFHFSRSIIQNNDASPSPQATDFNRRFHISVDESENRSQVRSTPHYFNAKLIYATLPILA